MTHIITERLHPGRSGKLEALMKIQKEKLKAMTRKMTDGWQIQPVALPQAGLGLLKLQDGAFHEPFYLGEFPLSSAHLSVTPPNGEVVEGAAVLMSDDVAHVESLALCDAILTHQLAGYKDLSQLVVDGQAILRQQARKRHAMLAKTRVDFSLLDDAGNENED